MNITADRAIKLRDKKYFGGRQL